MKLLAILFTAAATVVSGYTAEDAYHAYHQVQDGHAAHQANAYDAYHAAGPKRGPRIRSPAAKQQPEPRVRIPTEPVPLRVWMDKYVSLLPESTVGELTRRAPFTKDQIDAYLLIAATPSTSETRLKQWRNYVAVRLLIDKPQRNIQTIVMKVMRVLTKKFKPADVVAKADVDAAIAEVAATTTSMEAHHRNAFRGAYHAYGAP